MNSVWECGGVTCWELEDKLRHKLTLPDVVKRPHLVVADEETMFLDLSNSNSSQSVLSGDKKVQVKYILKPSENEIHERRIQSTHLKTTSH